LEPAQELAFEAGRGFSPGLIAFGQNYLFQFLQSNRLIADHFNAEF
jgi:hypothetical protein